MMLINMLDIAEQLELVEQEAHYDIDTNLFDLIQGGSNGGDDMCIISDLTFKELAMYATGMAGTRDTASI